MLKYTVNCSKRENRLEVAAEITKLVGKTLDFKDVAEKSLKATVRFLSKEKREVVGTLQQLHLGTKELVDVTGVAIRLGGKTFQFHWVKG